MIKTKRKGTTELPKKEFLLAVIEDIKGRIPALVPVDDHQFSVDH